MYLFVSAQDFLFVVSSALRLVFVLVSSQQQVWSDRRAET